MGRFVGSGVVYFHYLDDILLLGRDRALLRVVTRGLCEFLQAQSLLISTKSQTEPSALVTWIGKTFDLARGTVGNTPGTIRKALAVVVRAAVSNRTPKRVERVTGRRQWITQDKAPNHFNNTTLADQQCRVLLAPLGLSIVTMAEIRMLSMPQALVDTLQRPRRAFGTPHQTQTHTGIHTCDTACRLPPSRPVKFHRLPPLTCPLAYQRTKGGVGAGGGNTKKFQQICTQ